MKEGLLVRVEQMERVIATYGVDEKSGWGVWCGREEWLGCMVWMRRVVGVYGVDNEAGCGVWCG